MYLVHVFLAFCGMTSNQVDYVKYVHAISVQCIFSQAVCSLLTNCNDNQGK